MAVTEAAACSLSAHRENRKKDREPARFGKVATSEQKNEIAENGAFVRQGNRFCVPFGNREGEIL